MNATAAPAHPATLFPLSIPTPDERTSLPLQVTTTALTTTIGGAILGSLAALPALAVGATAGAIKHGIHVALPVPKHPGVDLAMNTATGMAAAGAAAWGLSKLGWVSGVAFKTGALATLLGSGALLGVTVGATIVAGVIAAIISATHVRRFHTL